ncbi:MAG: hypothetical protein JNJ83_08275 [Verrucomicrobiaceae bacterium]|nr:hypothetical protein [Verrucomicrobiaceae bacterium]
MHQVRHFIASGCSFILLMLLCLLSLACCSRRTNDPHTQFDFIDLDASKIAEIAFLAYKDEWGESGELVAVAPPVRSQREIQAFVQATQLDLPPKPGTEYLAGVVCTIAILGEDKKVIHSSTLYAANAVIGSSQLKYLPLSGTYESITDTSVVSRPMPRKAPLFGKYVLDYLRRHRPEKYQGVWFIKVDD